MQQEVEDLSKDLIVQNLNHANIISEMKKALLEKGKHNLKNMKCRQMLIPFKYLNDFEFRFNQETSE